MTASKKISEAGKVAFDNFLRVPYISCGDAWDGLLYVQLPTYYYLRCMNYRSIALEFEIHGCSLHQPQGW